MAFVTITFISREIREKYLDVQHIPWTEFLLSLASEHMSVNEVLFYFVCLFLCGRLLPALYNPSLPTFSGTLLLQPFHLFLVSSFLFFQLEFSTNPAFLLNKQTHKLNGCDNNGTFHSIVARIKLFHLYKVLIAVSGSTSFYLHFLRHKNRRL